LHHPTIGFFTQLAVLQGLFRGINSIAATKAERRLWVLSGPRRRQSGGANFWVSAQPRAVLCAAKHDEGIYRLHSLT
jgi:hypothetical protein